MVRSLLPLQLPCLLNRLLILIHVVISSAARSARGHIDGVGACSLRRVPKLFATELEMVALQVVFHLCVVFRVQAA